MHFKMLSAICFILDKSKILSSDNGLIQSVFNFLPNVRIFNLTKLQAFADDNLDVAEWWFLTLTGRKTVGKVEMLVYTSICLLPKMFQRAYSLNMLKLRLHGDRSVKTESCH